MGKGGIRAEQNRAEQRERGLVNFDLGICDAMPQTHLHPLRNRLQCEGGGIRIVRRIVQVELLPQGGHYFETERIVVGRVVHEEGDDRGDGRGIGRIYRIQSVRNYERKGLGGEPERGNRVEDGKKEGLVRVLHISQRFGNTLGVGIGGDVPNDADELQFEAVTANLKALENGLG